MSAYWRKWWLFWLWPFCLTGCVSFHLPSAAPPVYYQLDYQPVAVHCSQIFKKGVRVWKFATSSPYGRTEMVVQKPQGKVLFSSAFQWVASPGTLLADSLLRDLSLSRLFPQAVSANDPAHAPLELSGHIFVFAWERYGTSSRAVLQVEVSLVDTESPRRVIFRREYDLRSEPFVEDTSAAFAQAMSSLVAEFSTKFQQDLCGSLVTSREKTPAGSRFK
jgi:ABC-type uncharacterized transport system auxiliary subunit